MPDNPREPLGEALRSGSSHSQGGADSGNGGNDKIIPRGWLRSTPLLIPVDAIETKERAEGAGAAATVGMDETDTEHKGKVASLLEGEDENRGQVPGTHDGAGSGGRKASATSNAVLAKKGSVANKQSKSNGVDASIHIAPRSKRPTPTGGGAGVVDHIAPVKKVQVQHIAPTKKAQAKAEAETKAKADTKTKPKSQSSTGPVIKAPAAAGGTQPAAAPAGAANLTDVLLANPALMPGLMNLVSKVTTTLAGSKPAPAPAPPPSTVAPTTQFGV